MTVCFYHNSKDSNLICDICKNHICSDYIIYSPDKNGAESGKEINKSSYSGGYCIPCAIKEEREKKDYLPHILVIGGIGLTIYFSAFYAALFLIGPIMVYFGVKKWTAKKSYEEKLKIRMIEFNKSIEEDKIKLLEEKY